MPETAPGVCMSRRFTLWYRRQAGNRPRLNQERIAMSGAETAHLFTFNAIDGGASPLPAWAGRPVLVVNTASYCGYTPQYRDLEALWRSYGPRGLIVLGVPSNDFGEQEPGS